MINDKLDIDILFVLIDKGLLIENSTVFQSQVGDQLIALKSMGFKVGLITIYKNKKVFDNVIGNKLSNNNPVYVNKKSKPLTTISKKGGKYYKKSTRRNKNKKNKKSKKNTKESKKIRLIRRSKK